MIFRWLCATLSLSALLLAGGMALHVPAAHAQIDTGLSEVGETIVLQDTDPRTIAARIVNVALGLVGIILVVIIIYAGFLYMTSGGDAEKTQHALKIIRNAVIGLIIILMSWGIARFAINAILDATGTGGGGGSGGGGGGAGGGGGGFGAAGQPFSIVSITPAGNVTTRKVIVKIVFNRTVAEAGAQGNVMVETLDGQAVDGTVAVEGRVVRFTPAQPCPSPNEDRRCFAEGTEYRVRVSGLLESEEGQTVACGGFAPPCEQTFRTGSEVDVTPPEVSLTYPVNGQAVPADALVDVNAYVRDQTGVAYVSFATQSAGSGSQIVGESAPRAGSTSPSQFDARSTWDTAGLAPGTSHVISATAYDIDSGVATSAPVNVTIRAASCFNGVQDGQETGLDCGGDPSDATYCGACSGSSCTESGQCASGVCSSNVCVEQPIITSVSPLTASVGSFVTIRGVNLGQDGQAVFLGSEGSAGIAASAPQACTNANIDTWGPTQVIVQVPSGAQSGPIRVTNAASGLSDTTNTEPNPFIDDFVVDDTQYPGVCAVIPNQGEAGDAIRIVGSGFGNTVSGVLFGARTLTSTSWAPEEVGALVPNVNTGSYPVGVRVGDQTSNAVQFTVTSEEQGSGNPAEILTISPSSGPVQSYVTLAGRNFGNTVGQVFFRDIASGNEALADTNFPPMCSSGFWSDDTIVVKVPRSFTQGSNSPLQPGTYAVRVVPSRAAASPSAEVNFAVNTDALRPGICRVVPSVAPVGSEVTLYGEDFTGGPGTVTFFQDRDGTVSSWETGRVQVAVPAGARSGPVTLTPAGSGLTSNGVLLDVRSCAQEPGICAAGEVCCADGACRAAGSCEPVAEQAMFAWRTSTGVIPRAPKVVEACSTGEIPSPSPTVGRAGGDNACVNATIAVRFTTPLEPASISTDSVQLYECTDGGSNPCATRTPVTLASGSPLLQPANLDQDYITLNALSDLNTETTYEVVLTTAIRGFGAGGTFMDERAAECGQGNAYCFQFRTRADSTPCSIGGVTVTPDPYTAYAQGPIARQYRAAPLAANDACVMLQCESYDWNWSASDGRASVTNDRDLSRVPSVGACRQTVTAQAETGRDNPVAIQASTQGVSGSGDLYISFVPPRVERFGPNCDAACINALVWVVFNVELDEASVRPENIRLERCVNENCLEYIGSPFQLAADDIQLVPTDDGRLRQINILPYRNVQGAWTSFLSEGAFYRVTVIGGETGIKSANGVPMAGLNAADGFTWTFRVKPGEAGLCQVENITMAPLEKYESRVGAMQAFVATPKASPDACSESGQLLVPESLTWASSDTNVATLVQGGNVDTGPVPAGCSGRCTFTGAVGRAGQTAQCGNGRIETTNARYCVNGATVPWGAPCTLLAPGGSGGEECDDANGNADDACNNSCLWSPIASVEAGGTCGNGILNAGEECDFGRVCQGALREGSTLTAGDACTSAADAAQCVADGGQCVVPLMRGCSPTCRNLGSVAGDSTCGNGDLADGEDCDDGNLQNGDGCSSSCLNEGSRRDVYAACGNSIFEPGEACERDAGGNWPAGCDQTTCLKTGVAPCTDPTQALCCGNGNLAEPGKDCDDGNTRSGDGCSATCLAEGSSIAYDEPSFCGNGILETGEQCENPGPRFAGDLTSAAPGGDGLVDILQVAQIVGNSTADAEGRMSSTISASLLSQNKSGEAIYGLQCGYSDERSCSPGRDTIDDITGLTAQGCCSMRPSVVEAYPPHLATDVCRNVRIAGTFNVPMDEASVTGNFQVAKLVVADSCPDGLQDVSVNPVTPSRNPLVRLWRAIVAFFQPETAMAQRWCAGSVPGRLVTEETENGTTFYFTLNAALEPRTDYRVRFMGDNSTTDGSDPLSDNADPSKRLGVKSAQGVVSRGDTGDSGPLTWVFTTGDAICTVNQVELRDTNTQQPDYFTAPGESHAYVATARSFVRGVPVPLSPIPGVYDWAWDNWTISLPSLVDIRPATLTDDERIQSVTTRDIVAKGANGTGFLTARLAIQTDTVSPISTASSTFQGTATLTVNLCENPWPSRVEAPFTDAAESPSLEGTPFQYGPFFNFSVGYCRDAGAPGPNEDLPTLIPSVNAPTGDDVAQGILRQYIFTFTDPSLQQDAIGIRVAANPQHLSPLDWHRSKGFTGNPQTLQIDGYEAVRDGRTVYVSAASTEGGADALGRSTQNIYSNIYLISYNEGAQPITRQIYDTMLESMAFNVNVEEGMSGACETPGGALLRGEGGLPVSCSADWECAAIASGNVCANFKAKLQRDLARLGDFQTIATSLATARNTQGSYPALRTGSYLAGTVTSRWPSWNETLGAALGQSELATDPVNRFSTCGRCSASGTACVADNDCPNGESCTAQNGYDPATCWNASVEQYLCPNDERGSHVYQYRTLGGASYQLAADFEVPPPTSDLNVNWWKPTPPTSLQLGANFKYTDVCVGTVSAATGSCGDGVLNEGETCETVGPSATRQDACVAAGNQPGSVQQRCVACARYENDPAQPGCFANSQCGNGRVDVGEQCDDGTENGRYGRCNTVCTGWSAYCGDSQISVGEVCDNGALNIDYITGGGSPANSCNLTCSGPAGYCGNARIDAGEQCDGGVQQTAGAICAPGSPRQNEPCTRNSDCGAGGTCGGGDLDACPAGQIHQRPCREDTCRWRAGWSACQPDGVCGDGRVNGAEQCDDGNQVNEDGCTNACTRNICGDGFRLPDVEECDLGTECRDEQGNAKACNGQACQSPEYGGTCTSCSNACKFQLTQGGYCGDNKRTPASGEQCDGDDLGTVPSCAAFGLDYAIEPISCSVSCQYTGCAACGSMAGTGEIEGVLFDTLFQQPVSGVTPGRAVVSLYYNNTPMAQTSADEYGYFRFTALDNNNACRNYEIRVDATGDNPNTPQLDEGTRGGYVSVTVRPFAPTNAALVTAVQASSQGVGRISPHDANKTIAQINMMPRLGEDEYVVQLWWDPAGGYDNTEKAFRASLSEAGCADGSCFYEENVLEMHDLSVRLPYTYAPGDTPSACTPVSTPSPYIGRGRNTASLQGDENAFPGATSVDNVSNTYTDMALCTNKVRATSRRTCMGENVPGALQGKIGCMGSAECRHRFGFAASTCDGPPEANRSGSPTVLSGATGAYLFCYHPEWPDDDSRRNDNSCTNFVLPPQSVFIRASAGQYDILVSKYRLFVTGSNRDTKSFIREWLVARNAELRVYDRSGLRETVAFNDNWVGQRNGAAIGWASLDNVFNADTGVGGACNEGITADTGNSVVRRLVENLDAITISPVWTPFSIDTGSDVVIPWAGGNAGADYMYFADLSHGVARVPYDRGNRVADLACYEESCQDSGGHLPCNESDRENDNEGR